MNILGPRRTSYVDIINIKSVSSCSLLQVGDSQVINMFTKALADQREYPLFYGREGDFDDYSVFSEPIPQFLPGARVDMNVINDCSAIKVHSIKVIGTSFSSLIHVGSTCDIFGEARVKHIRELETAESKNNPNIKKDDADSSSSSKGKKKQKVTPGNTPVQTGASGNIGGTGNANASSR
ncbi:spore germination protein GerPE [Priestia koreensis]|uniref:spore germination protein GerPE n=1 Tax=Priestia koreensis TaxID=284581 RepID=UPI0034585E23